MKQRIVILLALALLVPTVSFAGLNRDASIAPGAGPWTPTTNCSSLQLADLWGIVSDYPSPGGPDNYVAVYVATPDYSPPLSVMGVDFGISYGAGLQITAWTSCGPLELPEANWPQSGSGNSVAWWTPASGRAILVGWFRLTVIPGLPREQYFFTLGPQPRYGVMRAVDTNGVFDILDCWRGGHTFDCDADFYSPPVAVRNPTWGRIKAQWN